MARNFKIHTHRNGDNMHLDLMGDFDGSSAYELVELLKNRGHKNSRVYIHTNALKEIHPFGRNVFLSNFDSLSDNYGNVLFTGEHAEELSPEGRTIH